MSQHLCSMAYLVWAYQVQQETATSSQSSRQTSGGQVQIPLPQHHSLSECISEPEVKGSASKEHEFSRPAGPCCALHAEPRVGGSLQHRQPSPRPGPDCVVSSSHTTPAPPLLLKFAPQQLLRNPRHVSIYALPQVDGCVPN